MRVKGQNFEASVRCGNFYDSTSKIRTNSSWTSQFYIHGGKVPVTLHVELISHVLIGISPCFFSVRLYSQYEEISRKSGELYAGDHKDIDIELDDIGIYKLFCMNNSAAQGQRLRLKISSPMFSVSDRVLDKRQSIISAPFPVFRDMLPATVRVHADPDLVHKFSRLAQYTVIMAKIINSQSDIAKCEEFTEFGERLIAAIESKDADVIRQLIVEAREKRIHRFKNKHLQIDLHKWLATAVSINRVRYTNLIC